jgi:hypothetical protein
MLCFFGSISEAKAREYLNVRADERLELLNPTPAVLYDRTYLLMIFAQAPVQVTRPEVGTLAPPSADAGV